MKAFLAPSLVSAILAGAMVVGTRAWTVPGSAALETGVRALAGGAIAFGVTLLLSHLFRRP